jgi:hypothetical protein
VIEAVDPIQIDLTSMADIYMVFDNLYMLWMCMWMCMWMCPHHIPAAHVDEAFGFWNFGRILSNFQAITDGEMQ